MKALFLKGKKPWHAYLLASISMIAIILLNPFADDIDKDYAEWIDSNERFVRKYAARGNVSTEMRYALNSPEFNNLLSHGIESLNYIETKYIASYESDGDTWKTNYHWNRMLGMKIAELRGLDCGDETVALDGMSGFFVTREPFYECVYQSIKNSKDN